MSPDKPLTRIALGIEYDGSDFCGWQTQPQGGSVQDALQKALGQLAAEPVRLLCAGRTDAGVHATAQVAHFETHAQRPLSAWVRGVNTALPERIAVRWAQPVSPDFHARFSAHGRRYRYLLLNRPERPGLWSGKVGWYHAPLDLAAMQAAAARVLGTHDFSAFRAAGCQAVSPVKTLTEVSLVQRGAMLVFDFAGNAFLHHMVRNLVGSLVDIGKGNHPPEWMDTLLAQRDRRAAAATFAASGLYLSGIDYAPCWGLPPPPPPPEWPG